MRPDDARLGQRHPQHCVIRAAVGPISSHGRCRRAQPSLATLADGDDCFAAVDFFSATSQPTTSGGNDIQRTEEGTNEIGRSRRAEPAES